MRMAWMQPKVGGPPNLALIGWIGISAFARGRPPNDTLQAWLDPVAHMANPDTADYVINTPDFPGAPAEHISEARCAFGKGLTPIAMRPKSGMTRSRAPQRRVPLTRAFGWRGRTSSRCRCSAPATACRPKHGSAGITSETLAAGRFDEVEPRADMT